MDGRRLQGVGALAAAVLVLSSGVAVGRPLIAGTASAPPVAPAPVVGDCVFGEVSAPSGPDDAHEQRYHRWFGPCDGAWSGEVVAVRTPDQVRAELAVAHTVADVGPLCASAQAQYLGHPDFTDPTGLWSPVTASSVEVRPDPRQYAAGQGWQACALAPPTWDAGGRPSDPSDRRDDAAGTSMRDGWADPVLRNRLATCHDDPQGWDRPLVFCGTPHDSELLARADWQRTPDPRSLLEGCAQQAGRMMERADPTAGGLLRTEVVTTDEFWSAQVVTAQMVLAGSGTAECGVRTVDPGQQLTATVVGVGEGPAPISTR